MVYKVSDFICLPVSMKSAAIVNEMVDNKEITENDNVYPALFGSLQMLAQDLAYYAQRMAEEWLKGKPDTIALSRYAKEVISHIEFMEGK